MADAIALVADEGVEVEQSSPSTCVLDDAPGAYRSMRRRADQMVTWKLRLEESNLRCRRPEFERLDWVRLYAMRHVLEARGVRVPEP